MATVKKVRKSTAPYYAAAAVWVLWALLRDLYRLEQFVLVSGISLAVFLLLRAVCQDEEIEVEVPGPQPESTGSAELDKMISDGQQAIADMGRLDDAIADEKISAHIRHMETVCRQIFDQVRSQPEKLPQIHRFMDYYLPTTLKLLDAYRRADAAGVSGENIDATKRRVEDIMDTISAAFDKQLDSLFGTDALDISTDISVLETMLEREGFKRADTSGPEIRLDL